MWEQFKPPSSTPAEKVAVDPVPPNGVSPAWRRAEEELVKGGCSTDHFLTVLKAKASQ
jgi:hypothetical protein